MSGGQIFALAIAAIAVLAAIAIFAVAYRRRPEAGEVGKLSRRDIKLERERVKALATADVTVVGTEAEVEAVPPPSAAPVPDPLEQRPVVSQEEYGVTRRKFFGRSILTVFGVFLLQFALGGLAFFWPRLRAGAFGSAIDAGDVGEIQDQLFNDDGTVTPFFVPAAQAYIVPFTGDLEESQFSSAVVAGGVMALWQRCVHLGCRVPQCLPSQGFECPCHGSKYNFHGEYEAGPAPRNLDRFVVSVNDAGRLIVETGDVIQTARAKDKTTEYPQGPSCL